MIETPAEDPFGQVPRLRSHRDFAIILVTGVISLGLLIERARTVLNSLSAPDAPVEIASLCLLVAVLLYLTSWYFGTDAELRVVEAFGSQRLVFIARAEPFVVYAAALAMAALAFASVNALLFAALLFVIKLIELWSSPSITATVRHNVERLDSQTRERFGEVVGAVEHYYLETPWSRLSALVLGMLTIAIAGAAYVAGAVPIPVYVWGSVAVFALLVVVLIVNETITWRWRRRYVSSVRAALAVGRARGTARRTNRGRPTRSKQSDDARADVRAEAVPGE